MIPRRIFVENFLSFGEPGVELVFADDEPLWVLSGPNGSGKSAVFDAITYALFAQHRGGKQEHHQLIRHTANNFRIVFEFAYDGVQYQIERVRGKKGKKTVQKVERRSSTDQEWEPVNVGDAATGVADWVTKTIGLDYIAFTSSVLLKQGEADTLINAQPAKRLELLKKLIHIQPIEELYGRVHEEYRSCKSKADQADEVLNGLPLVTDEQLHAALKAEQDAIQAYQQAQKTLKQSEDNEKYAKQHDQLQGKINEANRKLSDIAQRAGHAQQIRDDHQRNQELKQVVPVLEKMLLLPKLINKAQAEVKEATNTEARLQKQSVNLNESKAALESKKQQCDGEHQTTKETVDQLTRSLKEARNHYALAKEMAECDHQLQQYPADLDSQYEAASNEKDRLNDLVQQYIREQHTCKANLQTLRKEQEDFAQVEVGIKCSRCGQLVDAAHAEKEKQEHVRKMAEETKSLEHIEQQLNEQQGLLALQTAIFDTCVKQQLSRNQLIQSQAQHHKTLANLGVIATAGELSEQIKQTEKVLPEKSSLLASLTAARNELEVQGRTLAGQLMSLDGDLKNCRDALGRTKSTYDQEEFKLATFRGQLPSDWQLRWPLSEAQFCPLKQERDRLSQSNTEQLYEALLGDVSLHKELDDQLKQHQFDVDAIPTEARLPLTDIQEAIQHARKSVKDADAAKQTTGNQLAELKRQQQHRKDQSKKLLALDHQARLHSRLDELLGKDMLQRDLVRSAERDLVQTADTTLRHLTNGQLSLKLSDDKADDAAFNLQISKHHSAETIGIDYLSGSQKFRVAVALALAIGRYASSTNRPLESVIIDEGFGSLDRDGLASMADELLDLQRNAALKRIILVSHQEDFVERFPAGYALTPGEAGTTVKVWRR